MLDTLLHNHTLPVVDKDGQLTYRRATCAEVTMHHAAHTRVVSIVDGHGNTVPTLEIVHCHVAEMERQDLTHVVAGQEALIEILRGDNTELKAEVANARRLMMGSMQIVFNMGSALQALLAESLDSPTLTDDKSAVKVEGLMFVVLIDPFEERITVRPITGNVPERTFPVVGGRISEDDQTLLLGHVDRIKKAASAGGLDPVTGTIGLVQTVSAA